MVEFVSEKLNGLKKINTCILYPFWVYGGHGYSLQTHDSGKPKPHAYFIKYIFLVEK